MIILLWFIHDLYEHYVTWTESDYDEHCMHSNEPLLLPLKKNISIVLQNNWFNEFIYVIYACAHELIKYFTPVSTGNKKKWLW